MRSPYSVLGVAKTAKSEDIKTAYRQLAKTCHPDQNPDDPQASERFAEISHAYKLLSDADLRSKFDNGHIDARGRRRTRPTRGFAANPFKAFKDAMNAASSAAKPETAAASGQKAGSASSNNTDEANFEDMVVHIFGEAAHGERQRRSTKADAPGLDEDPLDALDALFEQWKARHRPKPVHSTSCHRYDVSLEEALTGCLGEIELSGGQTISFEIPAGVTDATEITVPSTNPDAFGDAIVTVRHKEHPHFRSAGADIHAEHAIDLSEAVLGGSFVFKALDGPLRIDIPKWSGSDTVLRIPGKGLAKVDGGRGALHVHLRVMLPEKPDPRLIELMRAGKKAWYV